MVYNVFSKLICILVMAEGGGVYEPPTEKTPLIPGTEDGDYDDDDPWPGIDWSTIPIDDPETTHPLNQAVLPPHTLKMVKNTK